jgi:hypothetical protein
MFDKPFLPSRGLRVVSAAALGIALAVLGGRAFSAEDKYMRQSEREGCALNLDAALPLHSRPSSI